MKKIAWTTNYRPFIMGGDVNAPIKYEVEATDEFDLGKGYKGFMFVTPKGQSFVCESETGAIVGNTIEDVKKDIAEGEEPVMRKQIEDAHKMLNRAYFGTSEEWWKRLK